jgi:hypothetical protein
MEEARMNLRNQGSRIVQAAVIATGVMLVSYAAWAQRPAEPLTRTAPHASGKQGIVPAKDPKGENRQFRETTKSPGKDAKGGNSQFRETTKSSGRDAKGGNSQFRETTKSPGKDAKGGNSQFRETTKSPGKDAKGGNSQFRETTIKVPGEKFPGKDPKAGAGAGPKVGSGAPIPGKKM